MIDHVKQKIAEAQAKTPTGVSFVGIKGYQNSKGEVADLIINVGASYENALEKDVETLKALDTSKIDVPEGADFSKEELETARNELLARLIAPDKKTQNRSKGQADAYEHIGPGMKAHKESGAVYVYGMKERKVVHQEGDYGEDRRKPLTKAKDFIRNKFLRSGKFRQYKLEEGKVESLSMSGDTVENVVIEK